MTYHQSFRGDLLRFVCMNFCLLVLNPTIKIFRFGNQLNSGGYSSDGPPFEVKHSPVNCNVVPRQAQSQVCADLGQQLKALWAAKANGQSANNGNGSDNTSAALEHYCQEHGVAFQRYEKGEQSWYAHKADGKWCREKS